MALGFASGSLAAKVADFLSDPEGPRTATFTMDAVRFPFNSPKLNHDAYPQLGNLVKLLKAYPEIRVEIIGHIDGDESDTYTGPFGDGQITLSEIRARCIYKKWIERGIAAERLQFKGLAAADPAADGDDRRLELMFIRR